MRSWSYALDRIILKKIAVSTCKIIKKHRNYAFDFNYHLIIATVSYKIVLARFEYFLFFYHQTEVNYRYYHGTVVNCSWGKMRNFHMFFLTILQVGTTIFPFEQRVNFTRGRRWAFSVEPRPFPFLLWVFKDAILSVLCSEFKPNFIFWLRKIHLPI